MSRSIRVTRKAQIRTDRTAVRGKGGAGKTFFKALIGGLSSATLIHDYVRSPRSYGGSGLRGDWVAVGNDIRSAMQKVNGE
jgi:hypothetical protein